MSLQFYNYIDRMSMKKAKKLDKRQNNHYNIMQVERQQTIYRMAEDETCLKP